MYIYMYVQYIHTYVCEYSFILYDYYATETALTCPCITFVAYLAYLVTSINSFDGLKQ